MAANEDARIAGWILRGISWVALVALVYLWIHGIADQQHQVIYVPTEGGLPIMEAGRFGKK